MASVPALGVAYPRGRMVFSMRFAPSSVPTSRVERSVSHLSPSKQLFHSGFQQIQILSFTPSFTHLLVGILVCPLAPLREFLISEYFVTVLRQFFLIKLPSAEVDFSN